MKRNVRLGKYKITYKSPTTDKSCCDWVSVEDVTSATAAEEKCKRVRARQQTSSSAMKKQEKAKKAAHREKYYIPMTHEELDEPFGDQGYDVVFNPPGDGNCQFSALAHLLQTVGVFRSEESLRREIVRYLTENPNTQDGFPIELFAGIPWPQYLASMAQNGTYGDHITLQAVANLYNVELVIISTLGPDARTVISPEFSTPFATLVLGHFAEDKGIHYVSLSALNQGYTNNSVELDNDNGEGPRDEDSRSAAHELDNEGSQQADRVMEEDNNNGEGPTDDDSRSAAHELDNEGSQQEDRVMEEDNDNGEGPTDEYSRSAAHEFDNEGSHQEDRVMEEDNDIGEGPTDDDSRSAAHELDTEGSQQEDRVMEEDNDNGEGPTDEDSRSAAHELDTEGSQQEDRVMEEDNDNGEGPAAEDSRSAAHELDTEGSQQEHRVMEEDNDIGEGPTDQDSRSAAHEFDNEGSQQEDRFMEDLPNEVLEIIIDFVLTGSSRSIVNNFNALGMINTRFRNLTAPFLYRLPRVSIDYNTSLGYHSMRQISKQRGKASGLVIALKTII